MIPLAGGPPSGSFHTLRRCICGAIPLTRRWWELHQEGHHRFREAWDFRREGACLEEARSWAILRQLVLVRDEFRCRVCDLRTPIRWRRLRPQPEDLEVHHIVPQREGGTHHPWNLVTLCGPCHRSTFRRRYGGVPIGRRHQRRMDQFQGG